MATGNTQSASGNRAKLWYKQLFKDVMDELYFTEGGLMGEGDNHIIQVMDDLAKEKGDRITVPLTTKLTGDGVTGDSELEGNEEKIEAYSEEVVIDQIRHAVRLTGLLDEQKNAYNMRMDAKEKLKTWYTEFLERQFFLKLGGVNHTSLKDTTGVVYSARALWSNTPDVVPPATEDAGDGERYICAHASGTNSITTAEIITPQLLSKLKVKARLCSPRIRPLRVNGKDYYVVFIHTRQAYDLKQNATFHQAMRDAEVRGKENPIFTGALGIWDGLIIKEHEYVPFLDVSAVSPDNFAGDGGGTLANADLYRAILCGRQAAVLAKCKENKGLVEKTFDYDNQTGFAAGMIGGIQKIQFNSKDYGVAYLDTSSSLA